jgi:hypothetical protein
MRNVSLFETVLCTARRQFFDTADMYSGGLSEV